MRSLTKPMVLFIFVLFLVACKGEQYPSILDQGALAITVNLKDQTISFVNIHKGEKIEEWQMDKPYVGGMVMPDGDHLLLYGKQADTIDLFSLREGKKTASWKTGAGITNGKVLENQEEIAFADQALNAIRFYTLDGKELARVKVDDGPLTLLEDSKGKFLYIISYQSNSLSIVDIFNKKKVGGFSIHSQATGGLLREDKGEIWIGGHGEGTETETDIHVYDASSGALVRTIPAPVMPINFAEKNDFIYVLSHGSSTLYKLDHAGVELGSIKIGANPFDMKILGENILVAGYDSNDIHLIKAENLQNVSTISVGKGPFQLILRERVSGE